VGYRLDGAGDVLIAPLDEERPRADEAGDVWHLAQRANACNTARSGPAQDLASWLWWADTAPAGAGVSLLTEGVVADAVADPVGLLERGEEAAERRRAHPRLERRHHDPEPTTTRQPSDPNAVLVDEGTTTALRLQLLEQVDRTDEVVGAEAGHVVPQHVQLAPGHVAASLLRIGSLPHARIVGADGEHPLLGQLRPVGDAEGGVDLGGARDVGLAVGRVAGDAHLKSRAQSQGIRRTAG